MSFSHFLHFCVFFLHCLFLSIIITYLFKYTVFILHPYCAQEIQFQQKNASSSHLLGGDRFKNIQKRGRPYSNRDGQCIMLL